MVRLSCISTKGLLSFSLSVSLLSSEMVGFGEKFARGLDVPRELSVLAEEVWAWSLLPSPYFVPPSAFLRAEYL